MTVHLAVLDSTIPHGDWPIASRSTVVHSLVASACIISSMQRRQTTVLLKRVEADRVKETSRSMSRGTDEHLDFRNSTGS
jgi:hypothetical protein